MNFLQNARKFALLIFLSCTLSNAFGQVASGADTIAVIQPYSYNVSPSGSFSYSLPIDIPPGIKNMVPNLSITYTSQAGQGLLGMGWDGIFQDYLV